MIIISFFNLISYLKSIKSNFKLSSCKQYKIFKDIPDGFFIDKLSGDVLFDTHERFHPKTGSLSFYKTAKEAVKERVDNSYGMKRVKIVTKKTVFI